MSRQSCQCKECVLACMTRPCWGTPDDAKKLMAAGFADRLMLDVWPTPDYREVELLCPAVVGYEGKDAPDPTERIGIVSLAAVSLLSGTMLENPYGRCTFLTEDNKCELHEAGLKPLEGRRAWCKERRKPAYARHQRCGQSWDSWRARRVIARWKRLLAKRKTA